MTTPMITQSAAVCPESLVTPSYRDVRLDALRGLFLIIMTVDHLPSILYHYLYESIGYVSAAEGFIFLSGFVAGLTYPRFSEQQSDVVMRQRAWRRARTIYLYHLAIFFAVLLGVRLFRLEDGLLRPSWEPLFAENLVEPVGLGMALLYQPDLLDILPLYFFFLLITPLVVAQLNKNRVWLMLGMSALMWGLAQAGLRDKLFSCLPKNWIHYPGNFDVFAWQLLFVAGLCFGFLRYRRHGQPWRISRVMLIYASILAATLFLCRHDFFLAQVNTGALESGADKTTLGYLRVVNFTVICVLMAYGLERLKVVPLVNRIAYLGRHSLQVFAFQTLIIFFLNVGPRPASETARILIVMVCVAALYLPAWLCELRSRTS